MSAFREHFLDKYFAYRRRYVDYILVQAPNRGLLANLSEVVRLAFTVTGSLLIGAILWTITVLSFPSLGTVACALMALAATAAAAGAGAGIVTALRDRPRVQERAAAAANAPPR